MAGLSLFTSMAITEPVGSIVTLIQLSGGVKVRLGSVRSLPITVTSPLTLQDPYHADLTARALRGKRFPPIVCGDDYALRVNVRNADDSAALDLTNGLLAMTWKQTDQGMELFSRRSDTEITPGQFQITIDDQTTDNGPDGEDGMGWLQVNFDSSEGEAMQAAAGEKRFDLRLSFNAENVITIMRGIGEFLIPDSEP